MLWHLPTVVLKYVPWEAGMCGPRAKVSKQRKDEACITM